MSRPADSDILWLHVQPQAPAKPAEGEACNGCGVCCLAEPCPLGMVWSGRRHGACAALHWSDSALRYECGLVSQPESHLPGALRWASGPLHRIARRMISSGSGCDCSLECETPADSSVGA